MIIPVIMCGGAGTRLWPASRNDSPKPFLPLVDGASTFALTLKRIADPSIYRPPIVIAGTDHAHLVAAALADAGMAPPPFCSSRRAAIPPRRSVPPPPSSPGERPDAMLLVLAADHVIRDQPGFRATVETALPSARPARIVVFGIPPTRPATGYGYIQPGAALAEQGVRAVERFVEKPDAERARAYIADGYLWNSGIFLLGAATARAEVSRHAPEIASAARAAVAAGRPSDGGDILHLERQAFSSAPKTFLRPRRHGEDRQCRGRRRPFRLVRPRHLGRGLGGRQSRRRRQRRRRRHRAARGRPTAMSVPRGPGSASSASAIVVVVATDDAVLVASRDAADRVKELTAAVAAAPEAVFGDFVRHYRPWGYYQSLDQGKRHQVKRIVVKPGARLSLQKHAHRAEHWTVVEGVAEITLGMARDALSVTTVRAERDGPYPEGRHPPHGQSRQDAGHRHRGAGRRLSWRGRHRPLRGRLRTGGEVGDRAWWRRPMR